MPWHEEPGISLGSPNQNGSLPPLPPSQPARRLLQPEGPQACAVPLGAAALLWVGKCHNLSVTDRRLSHRSLNPLPDATGKSQEKASSTHPAKTGITSSGVRAGKMLSCVSEPCMCWWHKGIKSAPAAGQHRQHCAPTALH